MWTLEQAVELLRMLEPVAISQGFHVALGGSVLIRGSSDKDLDIFIYPHKTADKIAFECLLSKLGDFGISDFNKAEHAHYGDDKAVYRSGYKGKRIDWFFLK